MAVTVYRYGLPSWADLPPVIDEQLLLAHRLRNTLVELEHEHEQRLHDLASQYPQVAAAEQRRDEIQQRVDELAEKVDRERVRQRTRSPKHPAVRQLKDARAELKEARVSVREAKAATKDARRDGEQALREQLREHQKRLYGEYVQHQGLYWACHNDVLDHHRVAQRRIVAKRSAGQPAQLRFRRWDGSGSLAVQLQRATGQPQRTPAETADADHGRWRNVLHITQGDRHGTVRMRVGDTHVTLPVVVDRDMHPDADITGARLTVRRVAGQRRAHLTITAKIPDPEMVTDGPVVAVHCGWRREDDDSVRVATWRAAQTIDVPTHLKDIVTQHTSTTGIVTMPDAWRDTIAYYTTVQARRDTRLEEIRGEVVAWLREHPQDGDLALDAATVARWRSPGRLARLAWQWHHDTPPGGEDITRRLMSWRRWDRRLWEHEAHGRRKALGRRDDAWRRVAAWIAGTAAVVVVDDTDLASLTRQITAEPTTIPTEVTQIAARQRVDAAPGYLRETIQAAASRDGVTVQTVPSQALSTECYRCGRGDNDTSTHVVHCDGCGQTYDRDESAVLHMIRRASGHSTP